MPQKKLLTEIKQLLIFTTLLVPIAANASTSKIGARPSGLSRDIVNRGFQEIAPIVTEVLLKKGDPFIEVFISGHVPKGNCFDTREYIVEPSTSTTHPETRIVARFRQTNTNAPCKQSQLVFNDKAADLDPNNPASRNVFVLGFHGWHQGVLSFELNPAAENK